ncbi:hypothetical protein [Thalassotalea fusca]
MKQLIIAAMMLVLIAACARTQPVQNFNSQSIIYDVSKEQVEKSIISALQYKRWRVIKKTDDSIFAAINVRDHYAEIEIKYSQKDYSIEYRKSRNLHYQQGTRKGDVIHRNYNKWIILLSQEIDTNLSRA